MPSYLARTGLAVFAMLLAIALFTERTAEGKALVAGSSAIDLPALHEVMVVSLAVQPIAIAVAGVESAPIEPTVSAVPAPAAPAPKAVPAPAPAVTPAIVPPPAPVALPAITAAPVQSDAIVLASWYGPGFYGNRTACGQTYTPEILGVAHLSLPCGTKLTLTYGSRSLTVTVIDRGPYIAGRTLDLSNATKIALGCTDLCTLRMQLAR